MKTNNLRSLLIAACERSVVISSGNQGLYLAQDLEACKSLSLLNKCARNVNEAVDIAESREETIEILSDYGFDVSAYDELSNSELHALSSMIVDVCVLAYHGAEIDCESVVGLLIS